MINSMKKILVPLAYLVIAFVLTGQELGTVGEEVTRISDTGHQVQVWEVLPEFSQNAVYEVSIKHAVEGEKGGFYMISWADTDNDGKPDKEIGRSEFKTVKKAGEWSVWQFQSEYDRIFIGNTWSRNDEKVYYEQIEPEGYTGLSNTVYYSRTFDTVPKSKTVPRATNIKIKISPQEIKEFGTIGEEVTRISDTGHQIQVWEVLPEFSKKAVYEVRIKHAVEGQRGGFYMISWADTDNDGKPDKEIGRSEFKTVKKAGEWSVWQFQSEYDRIFIGNTWSRNDEKVYYEQIEPEGYTGLSNIVYYSRTFDTVPKSKTGPRATNIKIKIVE